MTGVPREMSDIDRAIMVVRELLTLGFVPVNNGLEQIWGEPWQETTESDIIARIRREFAELTEEPSFIDICWFRLPPAARDQAP